MYVVWRDTTLGNEEIFFKRSINNGHHFGGPVYLSGTSSKPINSASPQIVTNANANGVYIVWSKGNFDQGRTDVLFKRSLNGEIVLEARSILAIILRLYQHFKGYLCGATKYMSYGQTVSLTRDKYFSKKV